MSAVEMRNVGYYYDNQCRLHVAVAVIDCCFNWCNNFWFPGFLWWIVDGSEHYVIVKVQDEKATEGQIVLLLLLLLLLLLWFWIIVAIVLVIVVENV